jgi:hypothetical protein
MNLPTRLLPLFGVPLIAVVAVSCAQPGPGDTASPTSPSAVAVPSATAAKPAVAAKSGPDYDASGTWCVVNTDAHGTPVDDPAEQIFTQDPDTGDISFVDEGQLVTVRRLSNGHGKILTYQLSFVSNEGGDCDLRIKGTLMIDTTNDTLRSANLRLKSLCSTERVGVGVIGRKGNCPPA